MNMFEPAEKQGWMNQSWCNLKACWHRENQSNCREPNAPQPCLSYVHGLGKAPVHKANAADVTRQRHPCVTRQRFWDIGQLMGTWHSHTGRIEFKERWRKTVRTVWNDKFDAGCDNAKHSGARSATPATQNEGECRQVPRLREAKVDVAKCHSCQAKYRGITGDWRRPSVPPDPRPSARSATPATQNEGGCPQVPRLPRETKTRRWISPSATPATQSSAASRATNGDQAPPDPAQCKERHACHAKRRWMPPSAAPVTQNEGWCQQAPRLPGKTRVDVKQKRMSPSATLATWNENACHAKRR